MTWVVRMSGHPHNPGNSLVVSAVAAAVLAADAISAATPTIESISTMVKATTTMIESTASFAASKTVSSAIPELISSEAVDITAMVVAWRASAREAAAITITRIIAAIHVAAEARRASVPRASAKKGAVVEPLRTVVTIRRAVIRRVIVISVRTYWCGPTHAEPERNLRLRLGCRSQQQDQRSDGGEYQSHRATKYLCHKYLISCETQNWPSVGRWSAFKRQAFHSGIGSLGSGA